MRSLLAHYTLPAIMLHCLLISGQSFAFSLDDMDKLDQLDRMDQQELLELAKQAAKSWNFSKANGYLEQARNKAYSPDAIKATEQVIASSRRDYEAEQQRKRDEAERQRREEEARRLAAQQQQYSGGSSGGGSDYVLIDSEFVCHLCLARDLSVSGPNTFEPSWNHAPSGSIFKGYSGSVAGTYSYSVRTDDNRHYCSGSFRLSSSTQRYTIRVYGDCGDAGSGEW
ncbi:hypothetical protein D5085_01045 [Ectothiorhodospiraceae bacterium BW-2]|nr:hypothetical protein D5085_01045 [Ectothiorhodospiraceae bacterium BW-2]